MLTALLRTNGVILLGICTMMVAGCTPRSTHTNAPSKQNLTEPHTHRGPDRSRQEKRNTPETTVLALGSISITQGNNGEPTLNMDDTLRDVISAELKETTGAQIINLSAITDSEAQFIIQGTTSKRSSSTITSVFLEAVDTQSGNVAIAANGRGESADKAAAQAANRLALELVRQNLVSDISKRR